MRVRTLDASGDMTFGNGAANLYANTPDGVAQCIITRLGLIKGTWFLDTTQGTDWGKIIGRNPAGSYDNEIRRVILSTPGVTSIVSYSSTLTGRSLAVSAQIMTAYSTSPVTLATTLGARNSTAGQWPLLDYGFTLDSSTLL